MSHHINPIFDAMQVYKTEPCARTFQEDMELHLISGYVVSTPDYFVMARPVNKDADPARIVDPNVMFNKEEWDCWHIYLYAGDIVKAWDKDTLHLPFVSFERKNRLRIYPMERIYWLAQSC